LVMALFWTVARRKGFWSLSMIVLVVLSIGYQFSDQIPLNFKKQLLKKETVVVRLEYYPVAYKIFSDKPVFGLGFNSFCQITKT